MARLAGIGVLAGIPAGIVAGAGSRLAMRISALATGDECARLLTENDNRCGAITPDGTFFLLLFAGLFFGVVGGLFYAVARPWLPGRGVTRGLLFGLILLVAAGRSVFDPENVDFERFGSPLLNVLMFGALFPLYGAVIGPLSERLDRAIPVPGVVPWRSRGALASYALLVPTLLLTGIAVVGLVVSSVASGEPVPVAAFAYILVLVPLVRRALPARPTLAPAAYVLFVLPLVVGAFFTLRGLAGIL